MSAVDDTEKVKRKMNSIKTSEEWIHVSEKWIKSEFWIEKQKWQISSVQSLSCVQLFATPWTATCQASLSITNSQTHVNRVGDTMQASHPPSSPSPPTFNLCQHQGLFKWVSSSHQVAKDWSFSFSISPPNEYSGLNSLRMDWLDLLAAVGTLMSIF